MRIIRWRGPAAGAATALLVSVLSSPTATAGSNVRLTNDGPGAYVSAYTLATGKPYTDPVLDECSVSRGRQNEPSVAIDPRNPNVLIGSSNDYCGVYVGRDANGNPVASGPIWLGYYRSEDRGSRFVSSLVPGYPGDTSPFAALAQVRTASSGDPVVTWDTHGRVFMGSESSGDPAGTAKTFGDVWVAHYVNPNGPTGNPQDDGKQYAGTVTVAQGSAAPNLLGKFNDKTAIQADRTGGACDGVVYFALARFTGNTPTGFNSSVYVVRSTDHGQTFSAPMKVSQTVHDIQFPEISVTGNGHVYITFRQFADVRSNSTSDAVIYVKSTDCGVTFSAPQQLATFEPYDAADVADPQPIPAPASPVTEESIGAVPPGSCGDFAAHCQSGYTFFRRSTQVRSSADQSDRAHEFVYIVYDPSKPGTETPSGTTYGSVVSGDLPTQFHQNVGSQSAIFFTRLDGASGAHTTPALIDDESVGHQLFPDISADGGVLHAMWWDSRLDPNYSPKRPVGNDATGHSGPALDVFATKSTDGGASWAPATRITDVSSNPNYEQFGNRTAPFEGDYLWVSSVGNFAFTVWTDERNAVQGVDPRELPEDEDGGTADVVQCRVFSGGAWSGDRCPHAGGIDQNIYGDQAP
jgi:hypothetical protein